MTPEWLDAEMWRRHDMARYRDTPGQIYARVRDLMGVPWRNYG